MLAAPPQSGSAQSTKLFCHSLFSLLSGQSPVETYVTLDSAIAFTSPTEAVGQDGISKGLLVAASRHNGGVIH